MCNACGFLCCGSDEFSGCGCDGCEEPDCWSDDEDFFGDDDADSPDYDCACRKPSTFQCVQIKDHAR